MKISTFAWLTFLLPGFCLDLFADDTPTAVQVFNARYGKTAQETIQKLREFYRQKPDDWRTRYYLATVLIEQAQSESELREADLLLDGVEKVVEPNWLVPWSLARKYEIHAKRLESLLAQSQTQAIALQAELARDRELRPTLSKTMASFETVLARLHQGLDAPKTELTGDEVREDLYALKSLVASRWAYVEEKQRQTGRSLDVILATSLSQVKPRMNMQEASDLVRMFVSNLLDGHCVVELPGAVPRRALPFKVQDTSHGLIVVETLPSAPFQVGDRWLEVEGVNAYSALSQQEQLAFGSTLAGRRWNAVMALPTRWHEDRSYRVIIERGGNILEFDSKPVPLETLPWLNFAYIASTERWLEHRMLSPNVGYLRISTWSPVDGDLTFSNSGPYIQKFCSQLDAVMAKLQKTEDLVLDLRGNGGGSDALCTWLASYFVSHPLKIYVLRYRQMEGLIRGDGFQNPEHKATHYPQRSGQVVPARLWVLVDSGCFSATDTFLNILTRNIPDRVKIIGRNSNGGIGGPQMVGILRNTRAALTVSTCKAYAVSGELLEGKPVKVDVPVQWTRDDIINGRDPDLEAALTLIRKAN